jgi:hypothetical protein
MSAIPLDVSELARVNILQDGQRVLKLKSIEDLERLPIENQKIEIHDVGYI